MVVSVHQVHNHEGVGRLDAQDSLQHQAVSDVGFQDDSLQLAVA